MRTATAQGNAFEVIEAYRTGKLTREQATKILIDNGWAAHAGAAERGVRRITYN